MDAERREEPEEAPTPVEASPVRPSAISLSSWPLEDLEDELPQSPLPLLPEQNPCGPQSSPRSWPLADLDEELPSNPFASAAQFPRSWPLSPAGRPQPPFESQGLQQLITEITEEGTEAGSWETTNTRLLSPTGEPSTHA